MFQTSHDDQKLLTEYLRLLLRLHELIAEEKGDTDEADEIRDQMDYPWRNLSGQRVKLVDGLSADLHTIGVDRAAPASKPDEVAWRQFQEAANRENWPAALESLRECEAHLPPDQVAYIRGACWAYLAQPEIAVAFLREKHRIKPLEVGEEVLLLTCLIQADRIDDATARAHQIAAQESEPALLLKAAEVLFVEASKSEEPGVESLHRDAIEVARRGLELGEDQPADLAFSSLRTGAYLHMALSYDQLGDQDAAIKSCKRALEIDPHHFDALMLYGYLEYGEYPQDDKQAFRGQGHRRLVLAPGGVASPNNLVNSP